MTKCTTKFADSKGRVTLGKAFANKPITLEERDGEFVLRVGRVIPEREAWLYENDTALGAVRRGLAEARARDFGPGPDLDAAKAVVDEIPDDDA